MSFWAAVPSLILFAVHVAVCVTLVTATGALALWLARRRSAPLRHTLALTGLAVTFIVPAVVAMYHWRLIPQRPLETTSSIVAPQVPRADLAAAPAPLEETAQRRFGSPPLLPRLLSGVAVRGRLDDRQRCEVRPPALRPCTSADAVGRAYRRERRPRIRAGRALAHSPRHPPPSAADVLPTRPLAVHRRLAPAKARASRSPSVIRRFKSQLESVLTHELAHIARFDYATVLLATVAEAAYWWNPFVHFARRELSVAREEVCDNYALNHSGDGEPLASYLLQTVEQAATARLAWGVGLSAEEPGVVARRIKHLLMGEKNSMIRISSLAACHRQAQR